MTDWTEATFGKVFSAKDGVAFDARSIDLYQLPGGYGLLTVYGNDQTGPSEYEPWWQYAIIEPGLMVGLTRDIQRRASEIVDRYVPRYQCEEGEEQSEQKERA